MDRPTPPLKHLRWPRKLYMHSSDLPNVQGSVEGLVKVLGTKVAQYNEGIIEMVIMNTFFLRHFTETVSVEKMGVRSMC